MNYPLISEYVEAIKAAEDNFDQLKHLRPVLGEDGEPVMTSGNFAVVFKMKDEQTGKLHAVKCFLKEQEGRAEAYRQIAEELEYVSSTFLTPIKYLDKELFVDSANSEDSEFPVLLMDWVEGQTLDKYIREHIDDQYELSLLAYQFSRLAMWLMPQPFAHGDLKPDNILVKEDGTLVLVDYDGMYVPAMKGQRARELGSPDFRHPSRTEEVFDDHIDDFSLASILLSLKAVALQPSLLEEYGTSDRLLFSEKDYRNLSESSALSALQPLMQDAELASLYSLYILALSQNNLSQVSFRLFNLSRPKEPELTEEDLDAWAAALEENMPHNNDNYWPLIEFARAHGKMQVGEFQNKETGELFKSCIFTKPDGTRTFVAFSSEMGELTPKEIVAQKNELYVVQRQSSGNYSLCSNKITFNDFDTICQMIGNFAVCIKGKKKGIVHKSGVIVLEPLFDEIEHNGFHEMTAYNDADNAAIRIFLNTFAEGLICAEEIMGSKSIVQFFMDKRGNKQIIFDEHWAKRNNIDLNGFHISPFATCHFQNGILKVDSAIDEYHGRVYDIDKLGNAKDVGGIDYKEFRLFDPIEHIDYTGYEEMGSWGVDDECLMDALDGDPEAYGNID